MTRGADPLVDTSVLTRVDARSVRSALEPLVESTISKWLGRLSLAMEVASNQPRLVYSLSATTAAR